MRKAYRLSLAGLVLAGLAASGCRNSTPVGGGSRQPIQVGGTQQAQGWDRNSGGARPGGPNSGGVNTAGQQARPGGFSGNTAGLGGSPQGGFQPSSGFQGGGSGLTPSQGQQGGSPIGLGGQSSPFPSTGLNPAPVPPAPPVAPLGGQERISGSSPLFPAPQEMPQVPGSGSPLVRTTQQPTFPTPPDAPAPIVVNHETAPHHPAPVQQPPSAPDLPPPAPPLP